MVNIGRRKVNKLIVVFCNLELAMPVRTFLFVSLIMTLYLCLYNSVVFGVVESQTIYDNQEMKRPSLDVDVKVSVDTAEPLSHIEEYFISFNIDSQEFGEHFEKMNFRLFYLFGHLYAVFT